MARVFEFGPVSALGMFPVTNRAEMRGRSGNELAAIADDDFQGIWSGADGEARRDRRVRGLFQAAYPGTRFEDMTFAHASNAIAGFFVDQFSSRNSPWDRFLARQRRCAHDAAARRCADLPHAKCSICHTGATFSDEEFHNVAVAQIGPGQGNGISLRDDFGRMNVTGLPEDRYRFRTTPLRNVELTGPYGHDGSIASLREFVEHYSESDLKLLAFDPTKLEAPLRLTLVNNAADVLLQRDTLLAGVVLTDALVDKLMAYMSALTDDAARDLSRSVPVRVPSGLKVDR